MPGRESKNAKQRDRAAARAAAYQYLPANPFPAGSRLHRYYAMACQHRDNMDGVFREMEMAYGHIGTPRVPTVGE